MKYLCAGILFCMLSVSFFSVNNSMIGKKEVAMYQDSEFTVKEVERDIQYFEENRAKYTYIAQALLAYTYPEGADVQRVYTEVRLLKTDETLIVFSRKEETKKAIENDKDLMDAMMQMFQETDYETIFVNRGQFSITSDAQMTITSDAIGYRKGFYYNLQLKKQEDVYLGDEWYFVISNLVGV